MTEPLRLRRKLISSRGLAPGEYSAGTKTAIMACPQCGYVASLRDHTINALGEVDPSVDCPNCDFHNYVTLNDWTGELE